MKSFGGELIYEDVKKWIKNTFYFSIPSLVVALYAIADGKTPQEVALLIIPPICTSLMDLYFKYKKVTEYP